MNTEVVAAIGSLSTAAVAIVTVIMVYLGTRKQAQAMVIAAEKAAQATIEAKRIETEEARTYQEQHLKATKRKEAIERQEQRRRERIRRLDRLMQELREKRGQLQYWQNKAGEATETREILYGDAYSIMVSVGDLRVREIADIMIHPDTPFPQKVNEISNGLKRMAELVVNHSDF
jgi:hypothetical protein